MFDRIRKKTRGIGPLTYFLEKEEGEDDDAIEEASSTPDNSEAERSKFIQYRFHMAPEGSKESASEMVSMRLTTVMKEISNKGKEKEISRASVLCSEALGNVVNDTTELTDDGGGNRNSWLNTEEKTELFLQLRNSRVDQHRIVALSAGMICAAPTVFIRRLDISNNELGDDGLKRMVDTVLNSTQFLNNLRSLDISFNRLLAPSCGHLSRLIDAVNTTLRELSVKGNALGVEPPHHHILTSDDKDGKYDEKFGLARCAPLARSIESWETLHSLNLQSNSFNQVDLTAIITALKDNEKCTNLGLISFAGNVMGTRGAQSIARWLSRSTAPLAIDVLDLSQCSITSVGCRTICQMLASGGREPMALTPTDRSQSGAHGKCTIRSLLLNGNPIGLEGSDAIGRLLLNIECGLVVEDSVAMSTLGISNTSLGPGGIHKLGVAFQRIGQDTMRWKTRSHPLRKLDLSSNAAGPNAVRAVARGLSYSNINNITSLDLSDNRLGASGAHAIAWSLCNCGKIAMKNADAVDVRRHAACQSKLRELIFNSNHVEDDGCEKIAHLLECNTALRSLSLASNRISRIGSALILAQVIAASERSRVSSVEKNVGQKESHDETSPAPTFIHDDDVDEEMICDNAVTLKVLPSLTSLNLSYNMICTEGVDELLRGTMRCATVHSLRLNGNPGFMVASNDFMDRSLQVNRLIWRSCKRPMEGVSLYKCDMSVRITFLISALLSTSSKTLKSLRLEKCALTSVPPSISKFERLSYLGLRENRLKRLPIAIASMDHLKALKLEGNRELFFPPERVWQAGVEEVRAFLSDALSQKGKSGCNQMKLVVLGNPSSGKTTLLKALFALGTPLMKCNAASNFLFELDASDYSSPEVQEILSASLGNSRGRSALDKSIDKEDKRRSGGHVKRGVLKPLRRGAKPADDTADLMDESVPSKKEQPRSLAQSRAFVHHLHSSSATLWNADHLPPSDDEGDAGDADGESSRIRRKPPNEEMMEFATVDLRGIPCVSSLLPVILSRTNCLYLIAVDMTLASFEIVQQLRHWISTLAAHLPKPKRGNETSHWSDLRVAVAVIGCKIDAVEANLVQPAHALLVRESERLCLHRVRSEEEVYRGVIDWRHNSEDGGCGMVGCKTDGTVVLPLVEVAVVSALKALKSYRRRHDNPVPSSSLTHSDQKGHNRMHSTDGGPEDRAKRLSRKDRKKTLKAASAVPDGMSIQKEFSRSETVIFSIARRLVEESRSLLNGSNPLYLPRFYSDIATDILRSAFEVLNDAVENAVHDNGERDDVVERILYWSGNSVPLFSTVDAMTQRFGVSPVAMEDCLDYLHSIGIVIRVINTREVCVLPAPVLSAVCGLLGPIARTLSLTGSLEFRGHILSNRNNYISVMGDSFLPLDLVLNVVNMIWHKMNLKHVLLDGKNLCGAVDPHDTTDSSARENARNFVTMMERLDVMYPLGEKESARYRPTDEARVMASFPSLRRTVDALFLPPPRQQGSSLTPPQQKWIARQWILRRDQVKDSNFPPGNDFLPYSFFLRFVHRLRPIHNRQAIGSVHQMLLVDPACNSEGLVTLMPESYVLSKPCYDHTHRRGSRASSVSRKILPQYIPYCILFIAKGDNPKSILKKVRSVLEEVRSVEYNEMDKSSAKTTTSSSPNSARGTSKRSKSSSPEASPAPSSSDTAQSSRKTAPTGKMRADDVISCFRGHTIAGRELVNGSEWRQSCRYQMFYPWSFGMPSLPNDGDWSRNETFSLTQLKKENSMASRMCELKRVENLYARYIERDPDMASRFKLKRVDIIYNEEMEQKFADKYVELRRKAMTRQREYQYIPNPTEASTMLGETPLLRTEVFNPNDTPDQMIWRKWVAEHFHASPARVTWQQAIGTDPRWDFPSSETLDGDSCSSSCHDKFVHQIESGQEQNALMSDDGEAFLALAWRGIEEQYIDLTASKNFRQPPPLTSKEATDTDAGYFGRGIYLTSYPSYGSVYSDLNEKTSQQKREKQSGAAGNASIPDKAPTDVVLILSWVLMGRVYPVIEHPFKNRNQKQAEAERKTGQEPIDVTDTISLYNAPCVTHFDSHYCIVSQGDSSKIAFFPHLPDFLSPNAETGLTKPSSPIWRIEPPANVMIDVPEARQKSRSPAASPSLSSRKERASASPLSDNQGKLVVPRRSSDSPTKPLAQSTEIVRNKGSRVAKLPHSRSHDARTPMVPENGSLTNSAPDEDTTHYAATSVSSPARSKVKTEQHRSLPRYNRDPIRSMIHTRSNSADGLHPIIHQTPSTGSLPGLEPKSSPNRKSSHNRSVDTALSPLPVLSDGVRSDAEEQKLRDELVVFDNAQLLPRYIVRLSRISADSNSRKKKNSGRKKHKKEKRKKEKLQKPK